MTNLIDIRNLRVVARSETGEEIEIVKNVSLSVGRGQMMGLIGESGSGKTTIALAVMGYARYGCRIAEGTIHVGKTEVTALDEAGLEGLRGRRVSYIAQSAAAAFNPSRTIMSQVIESALIHKTASKKEARAKAIALFRALAVPDPDQIGDRYPHQVSGGQLQRLMAAMALITDPEIVIFDEPTTALDVTTQIEVLRAFKAAIRDRNTTGIYVTHDLAVIAQVADRIAVLRNGDLRELAETGALLTAPKDVYSQQLLAAAEPIRREVPAGQSAAKLVTVEHLSAGYGGIDRLGNPRIPILQDINFSIERGRALGVVGESGCGKSTLARVMAGLTTAAQGRVLLDGTALPPALAQRTKDQLRRVQLVFQMADTALNPRVSIEDILGRPLTFYFGLKGAERAKRVRELLDLTHLSHTVLKRQPGDLSGGQKQRVNLARALAAKPDLLLCDEVTSALDTVVASAILDLIAELRRELALTTMFISHDLKTVRAICDEIVVLYAGRLVERMPVSAFQSERHHPYSELLFASVPELRQGWLEEPRPTTSIDVPVSITSLIGSKGCPFASRCPYVMGDLCATTPPLVRHLGAGGEVVCHLDIFDR